MANRIEQIISEMEEFIDSCKTQAFNGSNIIVNKDEIEELLAELKNNVPEEIQRYQKIITNQEAILADAKAKADARIAEAEEAAKKIIGEAKVRKDELISEHQIMQQAYAQANEIVITSSKQAQQIVDDATTEANDLKTAAMAYLDDNLEKLEYIIKQTLEMSTARQNEFAKNLTDYYRVIVANRAELHPAEGAETVAEVAETMEAPEQPAAQPKAAGAAQKKQAFNVDIPIENK